MRHYQDDQYTHQIEIYSSRTASWRLSGDAFTACPETFGKPGVFWNGCLHWINCQKGQPCLYFDLDQELVKTMPMPPVPDGLASRSVEYFGEFRGHLYLIENYDHPFTRFDIMEMDIEYTGWNVKYRVNLEPLINAYPEMVRDYSTVNYFCLNWDLKVWFIEEDEEDSSSSKVILKLPYQVFSCGLKEMEFKKIHEFPQDGTHRHVLGPLMPLIMQGWFVPLQYMDTLAHV